jgi:hypothetical protein
MNDFYSSMEQVRDEALKEKDQRFIQHWMATVKEQSSKGVPLVQVECTVPERPSQQALEACQPPDAKLAITFNPEVWDICQEKYHDFYQDQKISDSSYTIRVAKQPTCRSQSTTGGWLHYIFGPTSY